MNEVTRIHLDRQSFTISVEAHKTLKAYLEEIEKQVGGKSVDVTREVELRMAELLSERGITGKKVILPDDVTFLKEQLGAPKDFREDSGDEEAVDDADRQTTKRLFRDTENGMLAGVAAGLANYFGVDAVLIRILFVVGVITGGWGILLYILLWLLVPEAKTSSERLQMRGMAVTVDNLKEAVEKADIPGAARRSGSVAVSFVNSFFKAVLKIGSIIIMISGLSVLFGVIATGVYIGLHGGKLFQENLFPIGRTEVLLLNMGLALAGLIALFVILLGMAIFRRKWPVKVWITGVLLGIFFVGFAVSMALAADVAPKVRDRYQAAIHTTTRSLKPFSNIDIKGQNMDIEYQYSANYAVTLQYFDNPDLSKIKTDVVGKKLKIDSSQFGGGRQCNMLCLFPNYNMVITVYSPKLPSVPASEKDFLMNNPAWQRRPIYMPPPGVSTE